nr:hypothetical protein Iba_chr14aCG3610 [Ipomoea batatas]
MPVTASRVFEKRVCNGGLGGAILISGGAIPIGGGFSDVSGAIPTGGGLSDVSGVIPSLQEARSNWPNPVPAVDHKEVTKASNSLENC